MSSDLLLRAENLCKTYADGTRAVRALNGVTVSFMRGQTALIVGPSGAGKSTLLHMLGGLDRPTSGRVMLGSTDLYALSDGRRAAVRNRTIGFVFQSYQLLPEFTAVENVLLPHLLAGARARPARERAQAALAAVGLAGRAHHRPGELSGGEAQRVAIARALVNEPAVLLCDEPAGNLDSATSSAIYDVLCACSAQRGVTLIVVSHDERIAPRFNTLIRLKDGLLA